MSLNLTNTPPSTDEINSAKNVILNQIAKMDNKAAQWKKFLTFCLITGNVSALLWALKGFLLVTHNEMASALPHEAILFTVFIAFTFFYLISITDAVNNKKELLESDLSMEENIDQKLCPNVLEWCKTVQVISIYQSKVSKQGRMLVNGEYLAMKELIVNEQNKLLEVKEAAACEQLAKWNALPQI